jgi:transcriptional regulator with XRE-family HTH domain
VPGPNPTVRQREIGMRLRGMRTKRGLTVEDVAHQLLCSATKISRLETGARPASLRDVRDLCRIYDLSEPDTAELMELAREARQPGWWTQFTDLNLTPHIGLEDEAATITVFSMYAVPALLQTQEYAEALNSISASKVASSIINMRIEALTRRQQILERDYAPRYRALLDEAVLHRRIGGRGVMTAQLEKILYRAQAGQATVQVIPFEVGAHGSSDSNFEVLEFDKETLPPIVFVEGLVSNLYQERPTEIKRYREAADHMRDTALSPRDSLVLINKLRVATSELNQTHHLKDSYD